MRRTSLLALLLLARPAFATEPYAASGEIRSVALSRSGKYAAAGDVRGKIAVWDRATGLVQTAFKAHKEAVSGLVFSPSGDHLVSASYDSSVKIWGARDGKLVRTLSGHSDRVNSIAISRSGDLIASGSSDRTVRVWKFSDGSAVRTLRGHSGEVYAVTFSPGDDLLASTGEDATVRLWKLSDGTLTRKVSAGFANVQYAIVFSPSGQLLATGGQDSVIRYWRTVDGGIAKTSRDSEGPVLALAFSDTGEFVASGGKGGSVRMWRTSDGELAKMFPGRGTVNALAAPNGDDVVISGGDDKTVRFWTMPKMENIGREWGATPVVETPLTADVTAQAKIDKELNQLPEYKTFRPNAYAVIIGIERYRDLASADYATRDAALMRKYFEKALGIPAQNILMRENERATLGDIRSYIESWLKEKAGAGSEVFVYYSGHGTPGVQQGGGLIVPYDALPETVGENGYSLRRLYEFLGELPIKRALVILDSCFSGAGGPRTVLAKGTRPIVPFVEDKALASGKVAVISAASGSQISGVHREARLGLLTYYLIRGLRGEADAKNKNVSLVDLYGYLLPKVIVDARNSHREQEPKLLPSVDKADPWNGETLAVLR